VTKTTVGLILQSPVPIVTLWGRDGVMIYNDAYARFAGNKHPNILGANVLEGWPEAADWNRNIMATVLDGGGTLAYQDQELELDRHGGAEPVWMNLDYSPILNDDGSRAGVIAIVVETTAKVRAERQLSGERERLRQMFDVAPGFAALLEGSEHRFTMANRAYLELVGRDVLGKTIAEALPEVADQGFVELLDKVAASRETYVGRAVPVQLTRDGTKTERFVDFVYQPMTDAAGEVTGIFVQGYDVTEHKRSEAVRIAHNEVLEHAISDEPLQTALEGLIRTVEKHSPSGVLVWRSGRPSAPASLRQRPANPCSSRISRRTRCGPTSRTLRPSMGFDPAGRFRSGQGRARCLGRSRCIIASRVSRSRTICSWSS
jgi:PAS domain S-box-containing protein